MDVNGDVLAFEFDELDEVTDFGDVGGLIL